MIFYYHCTSDNALLTNLSSLHPLSLYLFHQFFGTKPSYSCAVVQALYIKYGSMRGWPHLLLCLCKTREPVVKMASLSRLLLTVFCLAIML